MKQTITAILLLLTTAAFSQSKFSKHEISVNAFRNPSIGAEYRYRQISVYAGYYITALEKNVTNKFVKVGVTALVPANRQKRKPFFILCRRIVFKRYQS